MTPHARESFSGIVFVAVVLHDDDDDDAKALSCWREVIMIIMILHTSKVNNSYLILRLERGEKKTCATKRKRKGGERNQFFFLYN